MRFEPPIDRARLLEAVRDAWRIAPRTLEFLPVGFGACYDLRTDDGTRYFLKAWPYLRTDAAPIEAPIEAAPDPLAGLAFSTTLAARVPALHVAAPILTTAGATHAILEGVPLALFPFLEGTVHPERSRAHDIEVARALAVLHRAAPLFEDFPLRVEAFDMPFEPAARAHLATACAIEDGASPARLRVRTWARRGGADVEAQFTRLHAAQACVQALAPLLVLTHTDLHGNNRLLDDRGRLWLLDWDDVRLAPPEHDLWIALDDDGVSGEAAAVRTFIEAYRDAGGLGPLHLARFEFYLLRRYLEDWSIALARSLDPATDPRDFDRYLDALTDWGPARWTHLDHTLALLAPTLE